MRLIASTIALTAMLLACSSVVFAGGTLRLDEVAVGELDPAKASDYADSILMFNTYDTLVLPTQGAAGYSPHIATRWTVDGSQVAFKLREDVKFQSGHPLTATDVVYSFDRMKAIGQGLSYLFERVTSATAVGPHEVKFTLSEPYAPFIASLTRLPILDRVTVESHTINGDWGQGFLSSNTAGTGAYAIVSHNPQAETVMAKNPGYFLGVPSLAPDQVRLRYGLEAATVRTLIAQGQHDISSQWLPPEVLAALAKNGAQLLTEQTSGSFYIKLNTAKAPFDDVNCRLAVSNAFDYDSAIKLIAITPDIAQGTVATGAIPSGMLGSNSGGPPLKQDLVKAREYLDSCRHDPAKTTLEVSWIAEVPNEERLALLMQANFGSLGFNVTIAKTPWALFTEQVTDPQRTPNVSQVVVTTVTGDPDTLLYGMYSSTAAGTWQSPEYLNDAQVDDLLNRGRGAATEAERAEAYSALNARLMALSPTIYAYDAQAVFAASNRVKVPALSDDAKRFGLDGMGFSFRLMEMAD